MHTVITENDVSIWEDRKGEAYHFPKRYVNYLQPGTSVIYYKGGIKDKSFTSKRLSNDPHYFGTATIGKHYPDPKSKKGDLFALIEKFKPFEFAVPNKVNNQYLEFIPPTKQSNYWRDGVRKIDADTYNRIIKLAKFLPLNPQEQKITEQVFNDLEQMFESGLEGKKTQVLTTKYERDPKLRLQAVLIHGESCAVCGFNFEEKYGEHGKGFIHIHHIKAISTAGGEIIVNPETDLIPLCANCHAMIHRRKDITLTIDELSKIINKPAI